MKAQQKILYSAAGDAVEKTCDLVTRREPEAPDHIENEVVNLYPQVTFQTIDGFGGAMTDSCAYLLSLMPADQPGLSGAGDITVQFAQTPYYRVNLYNECDLPAFPFTLQKFL